jgi:hypothetical protein
MHRRYFCMRAQPTRVSQNPQLSLSTMAKTKSRRAAIQIIAAALEKGGA